MAGVLQRVQRAVQVRRITDAQPDAPDIGFVHDAGVEQLHRHRPGQLGEGRVGLVAVGAGPARRGGDAQCGKHCLGLILIERARGQIHWDARRDTRPVCMPLRGGLAARVLEQGRDGCGQGVGAGHSRHAERTQRLALRGDLPGRPAQPGN